VKQREISQEVFEAMLDGAIDDLRRCGMGDSEIFPVVEECFGLKYARRFCKASSPRPEGPMP